MKRFDNQYLILGGSYTYVINYQQNQMFRNFYVNYTHFIFKKSNIKIHCSKKKKNPVQDENKTHQTVQMPQKHEKKKTQRINKVKNTSENKGVDCQEASEIK